MVLPGAAAYFQQTPSDLDLWWSRLVSNQRPSACEADALPLSYETGELDRTIERGRRLARSGLSPRILKAGIACAPRGTSHVHRAEPALPGYGHAVADRGERVRVVVAGVAFTLALAGCGDSADPQPQDATSVSTRATAIGDGEATQQDARRATGRPRGRLRRFRRADRQCRLHDRRGPGPLRHHRPRLVSPAPAGGLRVRLRPRDRDHARRGGPLRLRRRHRLRPG